MRPFLDVTQLYEEEGDFWLEERAESPFFEKKYLDWLITNLPAAGEILDLGCGDGWPIASYLIDQGFVVTGVDGAKGMIAKATARFSHQRWLVGDMRTLNLGKTFAGIIAGGAGPGSCKYRGLCLLAQSSERFDAKSPPFCQPAPRKPIISFWRELCVKGDAPPWR